MVDADWLTLTSRLVRVIISALVNTVTTYPFLPGSWYYAFTVNLFILAIFAFRPYWLPFKLAEFDGGLHEPYNGNMYWWANGGYLIWRFLGPSQIYQLKSPPNINRYSIINKLSLTLFSTIKVWNMHINIIKYCLYGEIMCLVVMGWRCYLFRYQHAILQFLCIFSPLDHQGDHTVLSSPPEGCPTPWQPHQCRVRWLPWHYRTGKMSVFFWLASACPVKEDNAVKLFGLISKFDDIYMRLNTVICIGLIWKLVWSIQISQYKSVNINNFPAVTMNEWSEKSTNTKWQDLQIRFRSMK